MPQAARKRGEAARVDRAKETLERSRRDALYYSEEVGPRRLRAVLERAAADLAQRIRFVDLKGAGPDSFTAVRLRATLAQVQHVLRTIVLSGVKEAIIETARDAAESAVENTARYLVDADRAYRGVGEEPLALDEARMLDAASRGSEASVLRRLGGDPMHPAHEGILARYGMHTVAAFEEELRVGMIAGKSASEMRDAITKRSPFLQGKPAHWGERIVRTEVAGAHGRAALESASDAQEQLGDVCKILMSPRDDRTGADSIAIHGMVRRTGQPFASWNGAFDHPPDRPNDRSVLITHRTSWPIPESLRIRPWSEVLARWRAEGRKTRPPPRPMMTTIPLALFGAAQRRG